MKYIKTFETFETLNVSIENLGDTGSFIDRKKFRIGDAILDLGKIKDREEKFSIIELFVPDEYRRMGIATKLLQTALQYCDAPISAQCSNDRSIDLHYKLGFRTIIDGIELSLEETKNRRKENSSVNMISSKI